MHRKPHVLLIDDDREILRGLSIRLRAAGYAISVAHGGETGLAAAGEIRPDVILLDLRMPVMDGFAVLSRLREQDRTKAIPVVVLSANTAEKARRRALDLGVQYFLEKPYDPKTLIQALRTASDRSATSAANFETGKME